MSFLIFLFLSSFTIFLDLYFFIPMLTLANLSLLIVLFYFLINREKIFFFLNQNNFDFSLLKYSFLFVLYIFCINLTNNSDIWFIIKSIIIQSSIILCLPTVLYLSSKKKFDLINTYYIIFFIHFIFVLLQVFGTDITLKDLIPSNPIIGVQEIYSGPKEIIRASGAISNPITLAHQSIFFLCFTFFIFQKQKNLKNFFLLLMAFSILISTQARGAIFSLVPILILTYLVFIKFEIIKLFLLIFLILSGVIVFKNYSFLIAEYFPYAFKNISLADTHRFWTNYYISIGVLNESPLTGIAPEKAWDLFDKYTSNSYDPYTFEFRETTPTHHNQIFYYLRYYGLIGLFLFTLLYYKIYKLIKSNKQETIKLIIGSIILLDLFFSLTHNNKIFSAIIWIYLSFLFNKNNKLINEN